MRNIVEIRNRTIAQSVDESGVINAVKRIDCNHRSSYIDEKAVIGKGSVIYFFTLIYGPAKIGENVLIGSNVVIQGEGTSIGNNSRVGDFTFIPAGTQIEDSVFISQHVSLTNDKYPKSGNKNWIKQPITIRKNSSIGSGCVILPGVEVGENCVLGAGSVLTKNMPSNSTWVGVPAKPIKKKKIQANEALR